MPTCKMDDYQNNPYTQCLKITEKVSFNIASEASYAYILSGQKFIEIVSKNSILRTMNVVFESFECILAEMAEKLLH